MRPCRRFPADYSTPTAIPSYQTCRHSVVPCRKIGHVSLVPITVWMTLEVPCALSLSQRPPPPVSFFQTFVEKSLKHGLVRGHNGLWSWRVEGHHRCCAARLHANTHGLRSTRGSDDEEGSAISRRLHAFSRDGMYDNTVQDTSLANAALDPHLWTLRHRRSM